MLQKYKQTILTDAKNKLTSQKGYYYTDLDEATFIEKNSDRAKQTLHSTAKQAAFLAKKSKCKKLILGHISSRYINAEIHLQEAQEIFKNTVIAEDGLKIEF